jgi:shikimate kinase
MNLVLIGYRGTGKTTIGEVLAKELGMPLVSLDQEIVRRAGKSIPEIVEQNSWEYFRDCESEVVADLAAGDRRILDTGGGVVTRAVNVERLQQNGLVFLLVSSLEDIVLRIGSGNQRPSLTGTKSFTDEVAEVLAQREPLYRGAAHHTIDTSALSAEEATRDIATIFRAADPQH